MYPSKIVSEDNYIVYHINGILHRIDGPAIDRKHGPNSWFVNGENITDEVNGWIEENNISYPFNEAAQVQFKLRFL